jgi:hypothetical protein
MRARTVVVSLSLLVLGCARPVTQPSAAPRQPTAAATPAQEANHGTPLPAPDAAACASAARTAPGDPSVDQALRTIVGGNYAADHIGPEAFEAIEDHVRREPDAFLDAWARAALDPASHIDLYWVNVLDRTAAARPERTRELAACLLARFDAALAHPPADRDPSWEQRVESHRMSVYLAWRARPDDASWRITMPSRACTTTAEGATTLTVEVSCTCGEPVSCEIGATPDHLDVLVSIDPRAPAMCDDCYPGTGACTLPTAPQATRPPTINGLRMPLAPCVR